MKTHPNKISDTEIIGDIRKTAEKLEKSSLTKALYSMHGSYHVVTVVNRFGSWTEAVKLAGLESGKPKKITTEELLENIAVVWLKLKRMPLLQEMRAPLSKYSLWVYKANFGPWQKAMDAFFKYAKEKGINQRKEFLEENVKIQRKKKLRPARKLNYQMRYMVLQRDGHRCVSCGSSPANEPNVKLQMDHIIPVAMGGKTEISNLQTLCSVCNQGKGSM